MQKFLIALQFWDGDKAAALRLAQFLAQLEPKHSDLADFLVVHRFDCTFSEPVTVEALSRKFNLYRYRSPRRGVGWPHGCNDLWFSTMEWVLSMTESRQIPRYKCVFTCEADGGPVYQDWIARMSAAWDATQGKAKPVYIAGPLVPPGPHINGNCLVSCNLNFLTWVARRIGGCNASVGWDYGLRDEFERRGWADIPGMRSWYNSPNFTPAQYELMRREEVIWMHGDKSGCLVDYGLKTYFGK
jgi:hypothetical protein